MAIAGLGTENDFVSEQPVEYRYRASAAFFSNVNVRNVRFGVNLLLDVKCPNGSSPNAFVERNVNPTVNWCFATAFTLEP